MSQSITPQPVGNALVPPLQPNETEIRDFLKWRLYLEDGGPLHFAITAIVPNQGRHYSPSTKTFSLPREIDECVEGIIAANRSGHNVYWTVNPLTLPVDRKPSKADMAGGLFAHKDIDPECSTPEEYAVARRLLEHGYLSHLKNGDLPPTFIIDSGNGYWALYKTTRLMTAAETESLNRQLLADGIGDMGTHNIDRLCRLPGTLNYASAHKVERGYPRVSESKLWFANGDVYDPETLSKALPPPVSVQAAKGTEESFDEDESELEPIDEGMLGVRFEEWLKTDLVLKGLWEGTQKGPYQQKDSGSEWDWALVKHLKDKYNVDFKEMRAILREYRKAEQDIRNEYSNAWRAQRAFRRLWVRTPASISQTFDKIPGASVSELTPEQEAQAAAALERDKAIAELQDQLRAEMDSKDGKLSDQDVRRYIGLMDKRGLESDSSPTLNKMLTKNSEWTVTQVRRELSKLNSQSERQKKGALDAEKVMLLPSKMTPWHESAEGIFRNIAKSKLKELFARGGTVRTLNRDGKLAEVKPEQFVSKLGHYGLPIVRLEETPNGDTVHDTHPITFQEARGLLSSDEALERLPTVTMVSEQPVLVMDGPTGAKVLGSGFHEDHGILVAPNAQEPEEVPLNVATQDLLNLLRDFKFATEADKLRGVALLISPGLTQGKLLSSGIPPMEGIEADKSQAGKEMLNEASARIYGTDIAPVLNADEKKGRGVGSLREMYGFTLNLGSEIVSFANFRGKLDLQVLEQGISQPWAIPTRASTEAAQMVDASRTVHRLTSNGCTMTPDLANRTVWTRLLKQPMDYQWHPWPENGLHEHIRANQPHYLGCVHAVLSEWIRRGRPEDKDLGGHHDHGPWCRTMNYIVREIFGLKAVRLLDGHQAIKDRVSNPLAGWLREVCQAIEREHRLGTRLRASDIAEMCFAEGIDSPVGWLTGDSIKDRQYTGTALGRVFDTGGTGNTFLNVERWHAVRMSFHDGLKGRDRWEYTVVLAGNPWG